MPIGSVSVGTVFLHPFVFPTPQAQLWKGEKKMQVVATSSCSLPSMLL